MLSYGILCYAMRFEVTFPLSLKSSNYFAVKAEILYKTHLNSFYRLNICVILDDKLDPFDFTLLAEKIYLFLSGYPKYVEVICGKNKFEFVKP